MRICLNMIVKDEAHVIERALDSCVGLVDMVVISDTGSTDQTRQVVDGWASKHPDIDLHYSHEDWVDFATNRNRALSDAREHLQSGDLILFLDADDVLVIKSNPSDLKASLQAANVADGWNLVVEYADLIYHRPALIRVGSPWYWEGPVHEYLVAPPGAAVYNIGALRIKVVGGGSRSQDPEKFAKDAEVLRSLILGKPESEVDPRLVFYMAQSYRDAGDLINARDNYIWRYALEGGWEQERFYSAYQAGILFERLGDQPQAAAWLEKAYNVCPHRAEAPMALARLHRLWRFPHSALLWARESIGKPTPPDTNLFVETDVYTWRRWDEYACSEAAAGNCTTRGKVSASIAAKNQPDDERIQANLRWWSEQTLT